MFLRSISLFLLSLMLMAPVDAQTEDQEARALAFVEALGQSDPAVYEQMMQTHRQSEALASMSVAERQQSFESLRQELGQFELLGVMIASPIETRTLIQPSTSAEPLEIVFSHDPEEAYKLIRIEFVPFAPEMSLSDAGDTLAELLNALIAQSNIPAFAVAVFSDSELIEQASVGTRELGKDAAISERSSFHWGSLTKSVTATLAAQLVAREVIAWDTTIAEVFGSSEVREDYHAVTLSDLLNHRSGLPGYDDFEASYVQQFTSQAPDNASKQRALMAASVLKDDAPIYPPSHGHRYSNAGYIVAGVMLEKSMGQSWEQLVAEYVFKHFNMQGAGFGWPSATQDDRPSGHFGMDAESLEVAPEGVMSDLMQLAAPSGNVQSTLADITQYSMAHLAGINGKGSSLSAKAFQYLHTPPAAEQQRQQPYSYGWGHVVLESGINMQWHNGGAGSFYAEIRLIPELNLGFVIMSNAGYAERLMPPLWDALKARYIETPDASLSR